MTTPLPILQLSPMRASSWTTLLNPNCVPAPICADGCTKFDITLLYSNRHAVLFHGALGRFDNAYHAQSVLGIRDGSCAITHALHKMFAFQSQGLGHLHAGNQNVAKAHLNSFSVTLCWRHLRVVVINPKLFCGFRIVEHCHFVLAHDRCAAHLVGIKPAQVNVRHDPVVKKQTQEDHVLDSILNVTLSARAHVGGLLSQEEKNLRNIVRSKAPQGVLVSANPSQVDALRVDVINRAKFAGGDERLQPVDYRMVLEKMAYHQDAVMLVGEFSQLLRMPDVQREWFFDENVTP